MQNKIKHIFNEEFLYKLNAKTKLRNKRKCKIKQAFSLMRKFCKINAKIKLGTKRKRKIKKNIFE